MAAGGLKVSFLKGYDLWHTASSPMYNPIPMHIPAAVREFNLFKNIDMNLGG